MLVIYDSKIHTASAVALSVANDLYPQFDIVLNKDGKTKVLLTCYADFEKDTENTIYVIKKTTNTSTKHTTVSFSSKLEFKKKLTELINKYSNKK